MDEDQTKAAVEEYFDDRGVYLERIPEFRNRKTPDFTAFKMPDIYLLELKSPQLNFNDQLGVFSHLTKQRKLREYITKATKQFEEYDQNHTYPWILCFTSTHFQFHGTNLMEALLGYIKLGGQVLNDFRDDEIMLANYSSIRKIDAYVWLQLSEESQKVYQATYVVNQNNTYPEQIDGIINNLKMIKTNTAVGDLEYFL